MKKTILLLTVLCFLTSVFSPEAYTEPKEIKVFRLGSSSFGYDLFSDAKAIAEASGKYKIISDRKGDSGRYTRLEWFPTQPGLYEEWCKENIPRIEAKKYDFVIIQTIGWLTLTPEQQDRLCTEFIPDIVKKIKATGAEVILYDKYLRPALSQKDPKGRTWCKRYPEAYRLNNLLHIMAAKHAGIKKISFGGQAVTKLWGLPQFARIPFFIHDGHPGPWANRISALNFAYLLTGEDPAGTPVRKLPLADFRVKPFEKMKTSEKEEIRKIYEEVKPRVSNDTLTLSDEEAGILEKLAMENLRTWGGLLKKNLESDEAFAETMKEIRRIQGEMDKFDEYLDPKTAQNYKEQYAQAENPGELSPALVAKLTKESKGYGFDKRLLRYVGRFFNTREKKGAFNKAFTGYWDENSKLRDDTYLQGELLAARLTKEGKREELKAISGGIGMLRYVLTLPGWKLLLERLEGEDLKTVLAEYKVSTPQRRSSPLYAEYLKTHHMDKDKLIKAWNIYLDIWNDNDRLDRLKENNYPIEHFLEADKEFAKRIADPH